MRNYDVFCELLKEKGVKAADVSKATGISTSTLTDWKKGRTTPKTDKLQSIADYFGVSLEYLTTGKGKQTIGLDFGNTFSFLDKQNVIRISDEAKQFALDYDKSPDFVKQAIQTLLRAKKPDL